MFFAWVRRICGCVACTAWLVYFVACSLPGHLPSGEQVPVTHEMISSVRDMVSQPPVQALLYILFVAMWIFGGIAHSVALLWKWGGAQRWLTFIPLLGLTGMLYLVLQIPVVTGDGSTEFYTSPKYEVLPYVVLALAAVQLMDLVLPPWYFLGRPKWDLGSVPLD